MTFDWTPPRRRDNLKMNPGVHFGRTVETAEGRGAVAWIDFKNDNVHVQLFGAQTVNRIVKHGPHDTKSFTYRTWVETVFPYDEVTPTAEAAPTGEDLETFLTTRSSGKPAPKRVTTRRASGTPINYAKSDNLKIGELLTVKDQPNLQLYVSKAYTSKLIVVQDTVTGAVDFAEVKLSHRTGRTFLQLSLA